MIRIKRWVSASSAVGSLVLLANIASATIVACWAPYYTCFPVGTTSWCAATVKICEGTPQDASSTNPGRKANLLAEPRAARCEEYTAWSSPCNGASGSAFPCNNPGNKVEPFNGSCCRYSGGVPSATSGTAQTNNIQEAIGDPCDGPTPGYSNPYGD